MIFLIKNVNVSLAKEKKLIEGEDNNVYLALEKKYRDLFVLFLLSKVDLKKYDENLEKSSLDFGICFSLESCLQLKYIHLLNHFYIEKLNLKDLNFLKSTVISCFLTDEQSLFVAQTYKNLIKNNFFHGDYSDAKYKVQYKVGTAYDYFASNDVLVLMIVYSKNNLSYSDDEYILNMKKKQIYLQDMIYSIKEKVKDTLNLDCYIIVDKIYQ